MGVLATFVYRKILRRSAPMLFLACVSAVFMERFVDWTSLEIYHTYNQGFIWDDIKHKYEKKADALQ